MMRSFLFALGIGFLSAANAAPLVLVAINAETPAVSLTQESVAELFLGKRRLYAGDVALVPVDTANESLRDAFYQTVAGMSSNRVRAYWARRVFSAQGVPPREMLAPEAALVLQRERGTVIYTTADKLPAGARIVLQMD
jgi:hypothetical protein